MSTAAPVARVEQLTLRYGQTLALDDTADQTAARVAIYRMMRPGEPPTEDASGAEADPPGPP